MVRREPFRNREAPFFNFMAGFLKSVLTTGRGQKKTDHSITRKNFDWQVQTIFRKQLRFSFKNKNLQKSNPKKTDYKV